MKKTTAASIATLVAIASGAFLAPAAVADDTAKGDELHAMLSPVPTSKVTGSGTAMVHLKGHEVTVKIKTRGLLADAPHAQHFHIGAKGQCPPASAATRHNGQLSLNTTDGLPFYGKIGASLTTTGDTGADHSALAVDRFPMGASYTYERTFTVDDATAESLRAQNAVVVVHGIDFNGNGKYDNVLGASDLDPKLPSEATNPALCGPLKMAPAGAVAGGMGGAQANDTTTALSVAGGLLVAAGGAVYLRRRTNRQS
ncbi:LPXTG cell wall anchor domain-containing protein [Streptomyces sp. H27-C3]|uniref:LPXTG cell wall anchor domain-containing protein n=1 Tax=Streptomyces sp. H27-C3 TaxID=3046305 RepID=UPI0024B9CF7C|nr:LPXTG cell wall anchor domain-containing protein [Streptomyces sp. H27-C3]MDJ0464292.1 LPXTG cell wall anchor domain-containing protein [Streptomyces sp. H27-C3]